MNDWWNDPPDDEPGPWSDADPEALEKWLKDTQSQTMEEALAWQYPHAQNSTCLHGNEWGACDRCDHEADLAYDAWREKR